MNIVTPIRIETYFMKIIDAMNRYSYPYVVLYRISSESLIEFYILMLHAKCLFTIFYLFIFQ